jgi:hypothetical protein
MNRLISIGSVVALVLTGGSIAFAQQPAPYYTRANCVKVRDGKAVEYAAYLRDVTGKLAKYRVDNGIYAAFSLSQAVFPAGRAAMCDYIIAYQSNGFPPEAPTPEQADADYKTAGVNMTRQERAAKLNELSYLVKTELWRRSNSVGTVAKGSYLRINYFRVNPGMLGDWMTSEANGWKQLAEAAAAEIPGTGWSEWTLVMPGGQSLPYNARTIDVFPTWDAMGKGLPVRALWTKAHPNVDYTTHMNKLNTLAERPRVDVYKVVERITK